MLIGAQCVHITMTISPINQDAYETCVGGELAENADAYADENNKEVYKKSVATITIYMNYYMRNVA
jgi:hypothetical protein